MVRLVLTAKLLGLLSIKQSWHKLGRMIAARNFLDLEGTGLLDSDDTEVSLDTGCVCLSGHVSSIQAATTESSKCGQFGGEIRTDIFRDKS